MLALVLLAAAAQATPPTVSLHAYPSEGRAPLAVTFTLDGGGHSPITSWTLEFGDGASASGQGDPDGRTEAHTYAAQGSYTATLRVSNQEGFHNEAQVHVEVRPPNQAPSATLAADRTSGRPPLAVAFVLDGHDPDGTLASWSLAFGDGARATGAGDPAGAGRTHTYGAGAWTATLTVTDDEGATGTRSLAITVAEGANAPPLAGLAAVPAAGPAPLAVELRPTAADEDGRITAWRLDPGDGSPPLQGEGMPPARVPHAYAAGAWAARLRVWDDQGAEAAADAEVRASLGGNVPPAVRLAAAPARGVAPLRVAFEAAARDPEGSALAWTLDPGDGSAPLRGEGPPPAALEHTYRAPGTHEARLVARDPAGAEAVARATVTVLPPEGARSPGLRLAAKPLAGTLEAEVALRAKPGFDVVRNWSLDFGDGAAAAGLGDPDGLALTHAYPAAGAYRVVARLGLDSGLVLLEEAEVRVEGPRGAGAARAEVRLEAEPVPGAPGLVRLAARAHGGAAGAWSLDFGDGGSLAFEAAARGVEVAHAYPGPGAYLARASFAGAEATTRVVVPDGLAAAGAGVVPLPPGAGALLALALAGAGLAARGRQGRAAAAVVLLAAAGPLAHLGEAHDAPLRHTASGGLFTAFPDRVEVRWASALRPEAHTLVVVPPDAPDGTGRVSSHVDGSAAGDLALPLLAGSPAPGTWALVHAPRCGAASAGALPGTGVAYEVAWHIRGRSGQVQALGCNPLLWVWNWNPSNASSDPAGTLLLAQLGDHEALLGGACPGDCGYAVKLAQWPDEAQGATLYTNATPYYNVDNYEPGVGDPLDLDADGVPNPREALHLNSHPASDRSRPLADDDGDGVRNVFDPTPWWEPWSLPWLDQRAGTLDEQAEGLLAQALGKVPAQLPGLPDRRLDHVRRDALAAAAGAGAGALVLDGLQVTTDATRGEAPDEVWANTTEGLRFNLTNRRIGLGAGTAPVLTDAVLRVPDGWAVNLTATRGRLRPPWSVHADEGPAGIRGLWFTGGAVAPLANATLEVVATAPRQGGDGSSTWRLDTFGPPEAGDDQRLAEVAVRVRGDGDAPRTTLTPRPAAVNQSLTLNFTSVDGGSGWLRTLVRVGEGPAEETSSLPLDVAPDGAGDGPLALAWRSVDRSGNEEPWQHHTLLVDTLPPVTTLVAPPQPHAGPFTLTLEAHDATSGVAAVRYRLWQGPERPDPTEGTSVRVARDGPWNLEFHAVDHAGNAEQPQVALLHLDAVAKLALLASPAPLTIAPGATGEVRVELRNLAGEPAEAPRVRAVLPGDLELASADPGAHEAGPAWRPDPLPPGASWNATLTLSHRGAPSPGPAGVLRFQAEARYAHVARSAEAEVAVDVGPAHRLDLACPAVAAVRDGVARAVCILRNDGNVPQQARLAAGPGWTLAARLPEAAGWSDPADPAAPPLLALAPGAQRVLALELRGAGDAARVEAHGLGGAQAAAQLALAPRPLAGFVAEPAPGGARVRNLAPAQLRLAEPALLLPAAGEALAPATELRWEGPAARVGPQPAAGPQALAAPPPLGTARPDLRGRLGIDGAAGVLDLRLQGLDGQPLTGAAVRAEGAEATTDAFGRARLEAEPRRLADGFLVEVPGSGLTWRVAPPVRDVAAAWEVQLRDGALEARATAAGRPLAPLAARWTLAGDGHAQEALAPHGEGHRAALPEGARRFALEAPAWAGEGALRGGGLDGTLLRLQGATLRAPARPASLDLAWTEEGLVLGVESRAAAPLVEVAWSLLDAEGAPLAEGRVLGAPARAPLLPVAAPAEALAEAHTLRVRLRFEDGLRVALPDQPLAFGPGEALAATSVAEVPGPGPGLVAAAALLALAALRRGGGGAGPRRRPPAEKL